MIVPSKQRPLPAKLFLGLALAALLSPAFAGQKLVISGARTRVEPGKEKRVGDESEKTIGALVRPNSTYPRNASRARYQPGRVNAKLQRRLENERIEKDNWVFLAPGELQEQDQEDSAFGLRHYRAEDIQRKSKIRDYTFHDLDPSRQSAESAASSAAVLARERFRLSQNSNNDEEQSGSAGFFKSPNASAPSGRLGAHLSQELSLQTLLGPDQRGATGLGGDRDAMRSTLGNPGRSDDRGIVFGSGSATGIGDPVNSSFDATRSPMNPVIGGPAWSASRLSPGGRISSSQSAVKNGGNSTLPGAQRSFGPSSLTPFSSLPSPDSHRLNSPLFNQSPNSSLSAPRRKL